MEFKFNVSEIFPGPIVEINQSLIPPGFTGDRRALWDVVTKVSEVVNSMGNASATAQGLTKPITTADRLRNSEQTIYLLVDRNAKSGKGVVTGMLKTGKKSLYVFDRDGHHYQVAPPCVLDFYVHESRQRTGLGKQLFEHMLRTEKVEPVKMAVDRPSEKLLSFLDKHYGLNNALRQMNNYVVFDGFFPEPQNQNVNGDGSNSGSPTKTKQSANGLQPNFTSPYGRYGAPRPPCSMGQIIHNQSPIQSNEPTGVSLNEVRKAVTQSTPAMPKQQQQYNSNQPHVGVCQSAPNVHYHQTQTQQQVNPNMGQQNMQCYGDSNGTLQQQHGVLQQEPNQHEQPHTYQHQQPHAHQHQQPHTPQQHQRPHTPQHQQLHAHQHQQPHIPQHQQLHTSQNQQPHIPQHQQPHIAQQQQLHTPQHQQPYMPQHQQPHIPPHQQPHIPQHQQPHIAQHQQPQTPPHQPPHIPQHQQPHIQQHQQPHTPQHQQPHIPQHQQPLTPQHEQPHMPHHQQLHTPQHQQPHTPQHEQPHIPHHQQLHTSQHQQPHSHQYQPIHRSQLQQPHLHQHQEPHTLQLPMSEHHYPNVQDQQLNTQAQQLDKQNHEVNSEYQQLKMHNEQLDTAQYEQHTHQQNMQQGDTTQQQQLSKKKSRRNYGLSPAGDEEEYQGDLDLKDSHYADRSQPQRQVTSQPNMPVQHRPRSPHQMVQHISQPYFTHHTPSRPTVSTQYQEMQAEHHHPEQFIQPSLKQGTTGIGIHQHQVAHDQQMLQSQQSAPESLTPQYQIPSQHTAQTQHHVQSQQAVSPYETISPQHTVHSHHHVHPQQIVQQQNVPSQLSKPPHEILQPQQNVHAHLHHAYRETASSQPAQQIASTQDMTSPQQLLSPQHTTHSHHHYIHPQQIVPPQEGVPSQQIMTAPEMAPQQHVASPQHMAQTYHHHHELPEQMIQSQQGDGTPSAQQLQQIMTPQEKILPQQIPSPQYTPHTHHHHHAVPQHMVPSEQIMAHQELVSPQSLPLQTAQPQSAPTVTPVHQLHHHHLQSMPALQPAQGNIQYQQYIQPPNTEQPPQVKPQFEKASHTNARTGQNTAPVPYQYYDSSLTTMQTVYSQPQGRTLQTGQNVYLTKQIPNAAGDMSSTARHYEGQQNSSGHGTPSIEIIRPRSAMRTSLQKVERDTVGSLLQNQPTYTMQRRDQPFTGENHKALDDSVSQSPKLERPRSLSIQRSEESENLDKKIANDVKSEVHSKVKKSEDELDNIENDVQKVEIAESVPQLNAANSSDKHCVDGSDDSENRSKSPNPLTAQGFYDLKFYHSRLW